MSSKVSDIKRSQKESLLFREISKLYSQTTMDDSRLNGVFITRVGLSTDKGHCSVYFYSSDGLEHFKEVLEVLKLYKPSLRKALATQIKSRYTPEITFKFDDTFEKLQRIESLLDEVKS